jgi:membrane protein implicated in regulation of membrane protease activity
MDQFLTAVFEAGPWAWLILAVILFALEMVAPGLYLVWFGVAAAVVGTLLFVVDVNWELQLLVFSVAAFASVYVLRGYFGMISGTSDQPHLNERGHELIGRTVVVIEAFSNGSGRVKVGDTVWLATGPDDLADGARARVTAVSGTRLVVEQV